MGQNTQDAHEESARGSKYAAATFFYILAHEIRRDILCLIHDRVEVTYSEILSSLEIDDGLLNFHLRKIKPLVRLTEDATYVLSDHGKFAYAMLGSAEDRFCDHAPEQEPSKAFPIGKTVLLKRLAAFLIDVLILFVFTIMFLDEHFWQVVRSTYTLTLGYMDILSLGYDIYHNHAHLFFTGYAIFTLLEAKSGQTLGKYLLGIRVVKLDGRRLTLMDSAIRNLGKVFLLPLDILFGLLFYYSRGYIRFFDFYVNAVVEETRPLNASAVAKFSSS